MTTGRYRWIRLGAGDEFVPLAADETAVRVSIALDDDTCRRVASLLASRPDVRLTIEHGEDLEFLRWFPGLRRLSLASLRLRSIDGLRHVAATLEDLGLGDTLRRLSLQPVRELTSLRRLGIGGSWRDLEAVSALVRLERLGVGSIDLDLLRPLTSLRRFESGLGTVRNLELLPSIGRLESIELYRLRKPHDLTPLGAMPNLVRLTLHSTRSIASLPSLERCAELRWLAMDTMTGITDLRPIAAAPNLQVLLLIGMCQLDAESLRPLIGHPTLRAGIWGFCSNKRNFAAQDMLPLPPEPFGYARSRRGERVAADPLPWTQPGWDGIGYEDV